MNNISLSCLWITSDALAKSDLCDLEILVFVHLVWCWTFLVVRLSFSFCNLRCLLVGFLILRMSRISNFSADFLHIHSSDGFSHSSTIVILNANNMAKRLEVLQFTFNVLWKGMKFLFLQQQVFFFIIWTSDQKIFL